MLSQLIQDHDNPNIKGYCLSESYRVTAMAYANDVTVIIRNQEDNVTI